MADDEELQLALAASRATFEEEERRRSATTDLIHLDGDPVEERRRKETIQHINRLYSHPALSSLEHNYSQQPQQPANVGWQSSPLGQNSLPQYSQQHGPFPANPQILYHYPGQSAYPINYASLASSRNSERPAVVQSAGAPPLFPRVHRASESETTAQRSPWSPPSSFSQSHSHFSTSAASLPPFAQPASRAPRNEQSVQSQTATLPSRLPPPANSNYVSELFVPYSINAMMPSLPNGDLIDLGGSLSNSNEEIWREFDPLYQSQAAAQLPSSASTSALGVTRVQSVVERSEQSARNAASRKSLPARRPSSALEQRESHVEWRDLECVNAFIERNPPIIEQLAALGEARPTPPLRFLSPVADYLHTPESVKVKVYKDHTWSHSSKPITFTCDTSSKVDKILYDVVNGILFEHGQEEEILSIDNYALKIFGLEEELPTNSTFGKNLYVWECLMKGTDVTLEVGLKAALKRNGKRVDYGRLTEQVTVAPAVDPEDIRRVTDFIRSKMVEFEHAVKEQNETNIVRQRQSIQQLFKLLCTHCCNIMPIALQTRLNKYLASPPESLALTKNDVVASLHEFITSLCESSITEFTLKPLRRPLEKMRTVDECTERMTVVANSIHNLPDQWSETFSEFLVTVYLYYGTQLIDVHKGSLGKEIDQRAMFPFIPLSLYALFDRQLCTTPREARYVFTLSGVPKAPSNGEPAPTTPRTQYIAFTSIPLFDHKGILRQGQYMLSLKEMVNGILEPWGGMPTIDIRPRSQSSTGNGREPVLIVNLPFHDHIIKFPQIMPPQDDGRDSFRADFSSLSQEEQGEILDVFEKGNHNLTSDDMELLWQRRAHLSTMPEALPLVLSSVGDWSAAFLPSIYQCLDMWTPLSPILAIQLLLPQYPDVRVRKKAIEWIDAASERNSVFIYSFLPHLVEALRFEIQEDSALAKFLVDLSYRDAKYAFEIYHQLQQRIDHGHTSFDFALRCSKLQKELLSRHAEGDLGYQIVRQMDLLQELNDIQNELSQVQDTQEKIYRLRTRLGVLDAELLQNPVALPILPSFRCCGIAVRECSVFNSNAKPIKVVFRGMSQNYSIIHKVGDDMRQDALVLHLVSLMDDIWKERNLDLKMIHFRCMPVGYQKGMAELVLNCKTIAEIQMTKGLKGVFFDKILIEWLKKFNNDGFTWAQAKDNFCRSCAGWCVATYLLGIGDRHNDNILVTTTGHVFHIDFGKYMGDVQMAGSFKRDRVPFVFTPEMFYVINEGTKTSENNQVFIDYCTKAFNYLRAQSSTILNLLKIMACSGIPGINTQSIQFVETKLMLQLSENHASAEFTRMVSATLSSSFPRLNFAIHSLAQFIAGRGNDKENKPFGFIERFYNEQTDGRIVDVQVIGVEKSDKNEKYYYKMIVARATSAITSTVLRTFDEFCQLHSALNQRFSTVPLPSIGGTGLFRANDQQTAQKRLELIRRFVEYLFSEVMHDEVKHSDLVYTFFHSVFRDNRSELPENDQDSTSSRSQIQLEVSISCNPEKGSLRIFIKHAKGLAKLSNGNDPDTYVKTYIRPDTSSATKQKTQVVKTSCHPTFNQEICYDNIADIMSRILEISVWYSGSLDNNREYVLYFPLPRFRELKPDRHGNRHMDQWLELEPCKKR